MRYINRRFTYLLLISLLLSVYCTTVIAVMSTASVVDNPLVIGGLLLAGFVIMVLLVGIAYIVVKSVLYSLSLSLVTLRNSQRII